MQIERHDHRHLGPEGALFLPDLIGLAGGKEPRRSVERLLGPFEPRGPDARSVPELITIGLHNPRWEQLDAEIEAEMIKRLED